MTNLLLDGKCFIVTEDAIGMEHVNPHSDLNKVNCNRVNVSLELHRVAHIPELYELVDQDREYQHLSRLRYAKKGHNA